MKLFPQPITSPSRLDKYPPPLMRSLRSSGRSKSRGRSRLSPMFIRSNNKKNGTETQEPSSPKVTCFGQVRVMRSANNNNQTSKKKKISRKNRYDWIEKPLLCKCFVGKQKPNKKTSRSVWERWFLCLRMGSFHQRKVEEIMEETANMESSRREVETEEYREMGVDDNDADEEIVAARVLTPTSPPKNALLLMRSRSENYRPTSLATLFWGSPVTTEDDPQIEEENEKKPKSKTEPTLEESTTGEEIEEKLGFCEEFESSRSSTTTTMKSTTKLEDELVNLRTGTSDLPKVLRRSKSDPIRRTEEFDTPLNYYWKRRKLGFEEQYPHC